MGFGLESALARVRRGKKNPRRRLLVWATVIALVTGVLQIGFPVETYLRSMRDIARSDQASGTIVMVAIDDRSLQTLSNWPWPRRHHAALLDRLREAGAERIFFDIVFPSATNPMDDQEFMEALRRNRGRTGLAARRIIDAATGERYDQLPIRQFADHASITSITSEHDFLGISWNIPFSERIGGRTYPSIAAAIARADGPPEASFPVDYGVDYQTIPTYSAIDVLNGRLADGHLRGRTVVVGAASSQIGDMCLFLGRGLVPCAYVHVLAAEVLRRGQPVSLGWLPPLILAFAAALIALLRMKRRFGLPLVSTAVGALLLVPTAFEAQLVFVEVAPALFLLLAVGAGLAWSIFRRVYKERGAINATSGLPTLEALRQQANRSDPLLIAARVQNFAEIVSTLPAGSERALVEQIAGRLTLGSGATQLFQGDDGLFAWFSSPDASDPVEDQLDAMHALFRSPVSIVGTPVDLSVRFGVDSNPDRSIAGRLAGAIVAADEAAVQGLRWKRYELSKVEDAAWRLSLLSQLDGAMDSGDLWVAYQPKMDLATGAISSAEALVRWTHPERGAISPMEFIPAAEQSNRIERLTYFVLDRALRGAAAIRSRGMDFSIAVNLSARLIEHRSLAPMVKQLLSQHRVPANRLTLEVTETATLATQGARLEALEELREAGVQISIDDYGTGLSTLEYLKKVPAHEIKIDKSFVQSICKSPSDRLLVHSTIQLAHSLGRKVVAEGVEDRDTLDVLTSMGCDTVQGYLIGKPLNFRDLLKTLDRDGKSAAA